jgi:hypothetical protein
MWGWWWIFPVIGFVFMMIMIFSCSGFFRKRNSLGGMGRYDNIEDLKREIGSSKSRSPNSREVEDEMKGKPGFMATLMEK